MPKQPDRFCIQIPQAHRRRVCWNTPITIHYTWRRTDDEYTTRQEAEAAAESHLPEKARARKLPPIPPLSVQQKSLLSYLNKIGYDSCYRTLMRSEYSTPSNPNSFMGGMGPFRPLVAQGLLAFKIGVPNPHKPTKATCTVVALPWVIRYQERFGNWPSKELVRGIGKTNA